jgi:hypothetical protein
LSWFQVACALDNAQLPQPPLYVFAHVFDCRFEGRA